MTPSTSWVIPPYSASIQHPLQVSFHGRSCCQLSLSFLWLNVRATVFKYTSARNLPLPLPLSHSRKKGFRIKAIHCTPLLGFKGG